MWSGLGWVGWIVIGSARVGESRVGVYRGGEGRGGLYWFGLGRLEWTGASPGRYGSVRPVLGWVVVGWDGTIG